MGQELTSLVEEFLAVQIVLFLTQLPQQLFAFVLLQLIELTALANSFVVTVGGQQHELHHPSDLHPGLFELDHILP